MSSRFTGTTHSIQISCAGVYIPLVSATHRCARNQTHTIKWKTYSCSQVLLWIYLLDFKKAIYIYVI